MRGYDQRQSLSLASYFREIHKARLLSALEERALALRIQRGDAEAREELICANLRLVVNVARRYLRSGLSLEDLIEEGNLGLLRAVECFDPDMNTRFATWRAALQAAGQNLRRGITSARVDRGGPPGQQQPVRTVLGGNAKTGLRLLPVPAWTVLPLPDGLLTGARRRGDRDRGRPTRSSESGSQPSFAIRDHDRGSATLLRRSER